MDKTLFLSRFFKKSDRNSGKLHKNNGMMIETILCLKKKFLLFFSPLPGFCVDFLALIAQTPVF